MGVRGPAVDRVGGGLRTGPGARAEAHELAAWAAGVSSDGNGAAACAEGGDVGLGRGGKSRREGMAGTVSDFSDNTVLWWTEGMQGSEVPGMVYIAGWCSNGLDTTPFLSPSTVGREWCTHKIFPLCFLQMFCMPESSVTVDGASGAEAHEIETFIGFWSRVRGRVRGYSACVGVSILSFQSRNPMQDRHMEGYMRTHKVFT